MSEMPWMKWFPDDWSRDTKMLSVTAKGGWIEIISALHAAKLRGELTMTVEQWARIIGCSGDEAATILRELDRTRVADIVTLGNGDVTVMSRRMKRERNQYESTAQRVARYRERKAFEEATKTIGADCNGHGNGKVTRKKPEARSQKIDNTLRPAAPARAPNLVLEALVKHAEQTEPSQATPGLWSKASAALKEIRSVTDQVTPEEIAARARNYRTHFTDATISCTALSKHWGRCAQPNTNGANQKHNGRGFESAQDYSGVTSKL